MEKVENSSQAPHQCSSEAVLKDYNSSEEGINQKEAENRLEKYGKNEIEREEGVSPIKMFLEQFNDPLVLLLVGAMVISFFIAHHHHEPFYDSTMIFIIVMANAVIGFVQEYRAEQSLEALKEMLEPTAVVIRNGHKKEIRAEEVVPGDMVSLQAGDRVPADARLIDSSNLETQEAPLTGESTPVRKSADNTFPANTPIGDRMNMVFMGTTVTKGVGKAVVSDTGMDTEFGSIASEVQRVEREETPLMRRIGAFGKKLTILIIIITIAAVITEYIQLSRLPLFTPVEAAIRSFMVAVGLAISAVPEGLPAVVTITLALGMRTMARKNAIIRKLSSVETLGSTTVICSDKTGTMTRNEMTVKEAYVNGKTIEVTGSGYRPEGEFHIKDSSSSGDDGKTVIPEAPERRDKALNHLLRIFALCNNAEIRYKKEEDKWTLIGDPTEGALTTFGQKGGMEREKLSSEYPRIHENPFDSTRKMMSTVHKNPKEETIAYVKGAPEAVLSQSTHIYQNGEVEELTSEKRNEILNKVKSMTENALRVLAAAYKPIEDDIEYKVENVEEKLIFVGVAGMIDPPRENVAEAIENCRNAGIEVKMVTGDHLSTAKAIAKEIGLIEEESPDEKVAMTGRKVGELNDKEMREAVKKIKVFARVSPQDKVKIAKALKENGEIVAMTGDGVNDAPAVKRGDIGVSMGIKGTQVTREASDMVLADDDFSTIVTAVREGRGIYGNIRKFLRYLLESNFDEILLIGIVAFLPFYTELPLLPLQILWINLATDGVPATALAFDTYEKGLMTRKPRDPNEHLLYGMTLFVTVGAIMQFLGSFLLFHFGLQIWEYKVVNTMVLCEAIWFELFSVWNCRSEKHSVWVRGMENFKNVWFVIGVLINFPLTAAIVYFPPLQLAFHTTALSAYQWFISLGIGAIGLFLLPEIFMKSERR